MLKIGVTGGIGSGKSIVCSVFKTLGVNIYSADERAKQIMFLNETVKKKIIELFGLDAYDNKGVNAQYISQLVFENSKELDKLNSIVHPIVIEDFMEWSVQYNDHAYVIIEAALIFESDTYKVLDSIIGIKAPLETRIKRVMARDKCSKEEVLVRMNNQFGEQIISEKSDYIINNDGKSLLIPQILEIHNKIKIKERGK